MAVDRVTKWLDKAGGEHGTKRERDAANAKSAVVAWVKERYGDGSMGDAHEVVTVYAAELLPLLKAYVWLSTPPKSKGAK